jgi:hypothetical protein
LIGLQCLSSLAHRMVSDREPGRGDDVPYFRQLRM